jgi:succinylglutamate desuccinylase
LYFMLTIDNIPTSTTSVSMRQIGTFTGSQRGPLVIALGATHGNEPAGVYALREVFNMLEREADSNPNFQFCGKLVGFIGNQRAFSTRQRFIDSDLNRLWHPEQVAAILAHPDSQRNAEHIELPELIRAIRAEISSYQPSSLVLLDLHTTSAAGGIFSIPLEGDADSLRVARALYAPVILGLLSGLSGTLLHFAAANGFAVGEYPKKTISVAFESGQHDDPLSVSRAISAVINCLRAVRCMRPDDVDNSHDDMLETYAGLPKVTQIRHVHHIGPEDGFRMRPGYINFQRIRAGEHLADDRAGQILAPQDGMILMPLYQPKGSDGFFVVASEG